MFSFIVVGKILYKVNTRLIVIVELCRIGTIEMLKGISIPFSLSSSCEECNVFYLGSRVRDVWLFLKVLRDSTLSVITRPRYIGTTSGCHNLGGSANSYGVVWK